MTGGWGKAARRLAVAVGVLLVLCSCASIPTRSAVTAGGPVFPDPPVRVVAAGPAAGVSPADLIRGFLDAAPGASDEYAVARSFLTSDMAGRWRPEKLTVVYTGTFPTVRVRGQVVDVPGGDGTPGEAQAGDAPAGTADPVPASISVTVAATVDGNGRYLPAAAGLLQTIDVELRRTEGQWRIDEMPDVVLVAEADFAFQYRSYPLWFLDPTQELLVPEARWLPIATATATRLATELLTGASPWLAGAVRTAVPAGTALAPPRSVTTSGGVAVLELTGQARVATPRERALMQAQLLTTLQPVLGVTEVELRVDGGELEVPANVQPPRRQVDPVGDPVLVDDSSVLRLVAGSLSPVGGLPGLEGLAPSHPAASLDGTRYAVLTSQRSELRVLAPTDAEAQVVLTGSDLTAPSFDRRGWVWTTSAASDGSVSVVSPAGDEVQVDADWLQGRQVGSLRVSRDGTRVVVASTADEVGHLDVAGVERAGDGTPTRLLPAPSGSVGAHLDQVREAVWIGADELAVLGQDLGDGLRVHLVSVGGPRRPPPPALPGLTGITGGSGPRSLLVTVDDGSVLEPSGASWVTVLPADAARDPAFPG